MIVIYCGYEFGIWCGFVDEVLVEVVDDYVVWQVVFDEQCVLFFFVCDVDGWCILYVFYQCQCVVELVVFGNCIVCVGWWCCVLLCLGWLWQVMFVYWLVMFEIVCVEDYVVLCGDCYWLFEVLYVYVCYVVVYFEQVVYWCFELYGYVMVEQCVMQFVDQCIVECQVLVVLCVVVYVDIELVVVELCDCELYEIGVV